MGTIARTDHWWWLVIVAAGLAVSLYGFLLIFEPHFHFSQLSNLRTIIAAGVISGSIAALVAITVEGPSASICTSRSHSNFGFPVS